MSFENFSISQLSLFIYFFSPKNTAGDTRTTRYNVMFSSDSARARVDQIRFKSTSSGNAGMALMRDTNEQGCVRHGTYRGIPPVLPVPDTSVSSVHQDRCRTLR